MIDHRSYAHNLSSCEIITPEKNSGLNFFQVSISQLLKLCITAMINHVFKFVFVAVFLTVLLVFSSSVFNNACCEY